MSNDTSFYEFYSDSAQNYTGKVIKPGIYHYNKAV